MWKNTKWVFESKLFFFGAGRGVDTEHAPCWNVSEGGAWWEEHQEQNEGSSGASGRLRGNREGDIRTLEIRGESLKVDNWLTGTSRSGLRHRCQKQERSPEEAMTVVGRGMCLLVGHLRRISNHIFREHNKMADIWPRIGRENGKPGARGSRR